jgi:hypothetical protein
MFLDALEGPDIPCPRHNFLLCCYHQSPPDGKAVHQKLKADMERIKVVNKIR